MNLILPIDEIIDSIEISNNSLFFNRTRLEGKLPSSSLDFLENEIDQYNNSEIQLKNNNIIEVLFVSIFNLLLTNVINIIFEIGYNQFCNKLGDHEYFKIFCEDD